MVREAAAALRIELVPLPGYSPDFRPVEALWRGLREDVTYHHSHPTADDLIPSPGDQFALIGLGHQWKSVCGLMVSASRWRQRSAMTASRSASVAKCRLATGSSTKGQRCSAGCSSGL